MSDVTLGVVPMAAKPPHAGHFALVERAARECDEVLVVTSRGVRGGGDQAVVDSEVADAFWDVFTSHLPGNVTVVRVDGSPVSVAYKAFASAERDPDLTVVVYSGTDEAVARFPQRRIERVAPTAAAEGRVVVVGVDRASTGGASATAVRRAVASGDRSAFEAMMPRVLTDVELDVLWDVVNRRRP